MVLAIHELLELDKIGQTLSKDDPESARKLAGPHAYARHLWTVVSYVTPAVCTLIFFVGLALGDAVLAFAGGLALMTAYPTPVGRLPRAENGGRGRASES
jgi:hypothetical protein